MIGVWMNEPNSMKTYIHLKDQILGEIPRRLQEYFGLARWPSSKIKLKHAFIPKNQLTDSVKVDFRRAFDKWSKVMLLTKENDSYRLADIRGSIYACAFAPPTGFIHLDGEDNWVVDGEYLKEGIVDLESVAVHEIRNL
ncbi:hypothetical protein KY290_024805 [Solanum tuberosum]|uniref:Peptidase M10 metallopeptidase domain-containing protein n=1 Tax=Solanum tuberosum TaxID=4113 RepID=A0ABQ7URR6_SOLTU|nr:hypothetical protein KY290_024805 [Solanum tuberosum]